MNNTSNTFYPRRGMKAKSIKSVLAKKMDEWLATIEDEELRTLVGKNTIVTGGCIASMLLGEKVNDFDLYFRNKETVQRVADYYVARFAPKNKDGIPCAISVKNDGERISIQIKSAGIASEEGTKTPYRYFEGVPHEGASAGYVAEVMQDPGAIQDAYEETETLALQTTDDEKPKYRPVFMSTNAITLSHKLQLILRFYGEPDDIHKNYDYVHCTSYWDSAKGELTLRPEAMESLLARELRYVGSKYPVCSIIRLRKFIGRGWTINAGQIVKMALQVSELDLTKVEVLRDQLTGVDVAYFAELLEKVAADDPQKINSSYLIEIIDRMF